MPWVLLIVGIGMGSVLGWLLKARSLRHKPLSPAAKVAAADTSAADQLIERMRSQLRQSQLAYQAASENALFKSGFLARTSHELRSPLNSVLGLLQLIESDLCDSPEEEREFIQQAHETLLKMVEQLDEVIGISKLEHGTFPPQIRPVYVASLLDELYHLTHLQAANRGIRLTLEPIDPKLYVQTDARCLQQLLLNLLDIPLTLMNEGYVTLKSTVSGDSVIFEIEDERPAIALQEPLLLEQLQVSPEGAPWTKLSPGMRFLMAQAIASTLGGTLELRSAPLETATPDVPSKTLTRLTLPMGEPPSAPL